MAISTPIGVVLGYSHIRPYRGPYRLIYGYTVDMPLYSGHPPIYTGIWPYMLYLARIALYMGIYGYIQHCTVQWSPHMHCIHPLSIQWLPLTHCTPVWLYIRCIRPYCVIYGTIQYIYGPPCTVPVSTPIRHTGHPYIQGYPVYARIWAI